MFSLFLVLAIIFVGLIYLFLNKDERRVVKEKVIGSESVSPEKEVLPEETLAQKQLCQTKKDCVPLPVCHPKECINKRFEGEFQRPERCTLNFDETAAYDADDCDCVQGRCVNKNKNKKRIGY